MFKLAKDKYVEKKEEESGNITYIYDEKHIEKRQKEKAKKLLHLAKSISKLRSQVKKDINDPDPKKYIPALAVALIDETYERVGNRYSAKDLGHYGVSTWLKKHFNFSPSKVAISYVGKSGVKQKKEVKDKKIISKLKELAKGKSPNNPIFAHDDYLLNDNLVNKYLKPFNITAKDIRGWHANEETKKELKNIKMKDSEKERKKDFKKAVENAAKIVGHEPNTLKNQYLVPNFEKQYVENAKIISKLAAIKVPNNIFPIVKKLYAQKLNSIYPKVFPFTKNLMEYYDSLPTLPKSFKSVNDIISDQFVEFDYVKVYDDYVEINGHKYKIKNPKEFVKSEIEQSKNILKQLNVADDQDIVELIRLKKQIQKDADNSSIDELDESVNANIINPYSNDKHNIVVQIIEKHMPSQAFWQEDLNLLKISVNNYLNPTSKEEYQEFLVNIKETIEHELIHALQSFTNPSKPLNPKTFLPKSKSNYNPYGVLNELAEKIKILQNKINKKSPAKLNQLSKELTELYQNAINLKQKHQLRDVEFFPILEDLIKFFITQIPKIPKNDLNQALKAFLAIKPIYKKDKLSVLPNSFFRDLKLNQPEKYKKAITYFVKNISPYL